eukprot:10744095-Alexandrium_andersonii.AAC.1
MHPSGASGANFQAISGPPQVKLRTPQATFSRIGELRKAPKSSKELWVAPESLGLINLLYFLCLRAGRPGHLHARIYVESRVAVSRFGSSQVSQ